MVAVNTDKCGRESHFHGSTEYSCAVLDDIHIFRGRMEFSCIVLAALNVQIFCFRPGSEFDELEIRR